MIITGAILVGGASSRMGRTKHELVLSDGRTMLDHAIAVLSDVCRDIVMLCGTESSLPRSLLGREGKPVADLQRIDKLQRIADRRPGLGPLAGIEALLASGIDAQYLVVPCDVPLVSADLLNKLLAAHVQRPASVFRRPGASECDSLPARIAASALPVVRELLDRGERAVWRLMRELDAEIIDVPAELAWRLHNVNTPAEYEVVLRAAESRVDG